MMFHRGGGRRKYDQYKRSSISLYHRTDKWLSRKYGLSLINSVLLSALIISWVWILNITLSTTSELHETNNKLPPQHPLSPQTHHMRDLVERYQKMKWMDEHNAPHKVEQLSAQNESKYNHKSGDALFDIWSVEDLENDEICPDQFPKTPPPFKDMKYVCSHLDWFKFGGNCNADNCSDCMCCNSMFYIP